MNDAFARISAGQHAHPPINRERLYKAAYNRVHALMLVFPEGFRSGITNTLQLNIHREAARRGLSLVNKRDSNDRLNAAMKRRKAAARSYINFLL